MGSRQRAGQLASRELPDNELDTFITVPPLNYSDNPTVLRHLNVLLIEPLANASLCKALIMIRNSARLDPNLATCEKPNLLTLAAKKLSSSSDMLVRACAASCFAALASTTAGREWMSAAPNRATFGPIMLVNWLKAVLPQGRDGMDVNHVMMALGSCCLLTPLRDIMVAEGAVQLTVGVIHASLPQLLLGQSKAGLELTSGPYSQFKPMPYACHAALGLMQNMLSMPAARTQAVQARLVYLLEHVLVAAEAQKRPPSSWLTRAQMLAGSVGIHHVLQSMTSQRAQELATKVQAASLKAENMSARGLLAARQSPNRTRLMAALSTPLATNLTLAVEAEEEQQASRRGTPGSRGTSPSRPTRTTTDNNSPGSRGASPGSRGASPSRLSTRPSQRFVPVVVVQAERQLQSRASVMSAVSLGDVGGLEELYGGLSPRVSVDQGATGEEAGSRHKHKKKHKHKHRKHKHREGSGEEGSSSEGESGSTGTSTGTRSPRTRLLWQRLRHQRQFGTCDRASSYSKM